MIPKVKVRGDLVDANGERRTVKFYNGIDIEADGGGALYSLRLLPDGALEISAVLSVVRHGGRALDDKLVIRPESSGRVRISRDVYEPERAKGE